MEGSLRREVRRTYLLAADLYRGESCIAGTRSVPRHGTYVCTRNVRRTLEKLKLAAEA